MATLDLAIRGGTVVTASDTVPRRYRHPRRAHRRRSRDDIEGAAREIDASGCWCCPAASTAMSISRSPPARAS